MKEEEPKKIEVKVASDGDDAKAVKKEEAPPVPPVPLLSLWRYSDRFDKFCVFLGIVFSVGIGALPPIQILIFGQLVSNVAPALANPTTDNLLNFLLPTIKAITGIGGAMLIGGYLTQMLWVLSGENQSRRIRSMYVHAILRQDMGWFDKAEEGSLATRLANDTQLVQEAISEKAGATVQGVSQFVVGVIVALVKGWKLALVVMTTIPIMAIVGGGMMTFVTRFMTGGQNAYADAGAVAEEAIGGVRTVYSFSLQERFQKRYEALLDKAKVHNIKAGFIMGLGFGTLMFVMFCSFGLAFWYGSKLVIEKSDGMDGGKVLTVFMALVMGALALMQMAPNLSSIATGRAAASKVFKTIERVPLIDTDSTTGRKLEKVEGSISFKEINFHYPTRPNVPILKGLTLDIKPGMTVAFVGPSGSGKSTSVGLVQRFYDPIEGQVLLDGVDLKELDVKWLRRQIGIVSQEPVLFNMSIKENLLQGIEMEATVSQEEIEEACRKANCHNFITQLPKGYDTMVGDHGGMLSGGQKQRIAIARALLKNPRILLLDEATSALDTNSEKLVQKALDVASKDRTTIVIAHRLSTIKNADLIVVMKEGELVEKGTHDDLYNLGGIYTELVNKQKIKMQADPLSAKIDAPLNDEELEKQLLNEKVAVVQSVVNEDGTKDTIIMMDDGKVVKKKQKESAEQTQIRRSKMSPMRRVLSMMKSEWHLLLLGIIGSIGAGTVFPFYGFLFSKIIALLSIPGLGYSGPFQGANLYAFFFVVIAIGAFICLTLQRALFEVAGAVLTKKLRAATFSTILKQEIGFFDENSTGALTSALATDAAAVADIVTKVWPDVIQLFASFATGLIITFIYSWRLSLVVLCSMPFLLGATALESRVHQGFEDSTKKAYTESGEVASEAIKEIRTVKSLTREKFWEDRYNARTEGPHKLALKKAYVASLGYGAHQGFNMWTTALGFYAGIRFVGAGLAEFEDIFVVILVLLLTSTSMGRASLFVSKYVRGKNCAIATFELLDRKTQIDPEAPGDMPDDFKGDIDITDIAFRYPARPDIPIFSGEFGFSAKSKQTVALVGPSGCGKSTTIGLLERWYDPANGLVKVDGKNSKEYQLKKGLRSHMALVGQEPVLFDMSIGENIKYGSDNLDATQEEVEEVARMSNIHSFISELPDGYNTRVGDKGSQLSGGQKQRIAIARALIRKPKILLLDEATSALDSESEKLVQEALDKAVEGRTTITIAHRLSTIQNADLICVVKEGKVVESGKHFDLLALNGVYKDLVDQQDLNALA
eukprot:TRINITY_DN93_c0_g1_i2.p1 TRINITY_DN93_c0_g1~~TRINITY_DN93_c0_g1_i2.p1  ORF type:complete len:1279 (-),score=509.25 TRINITY_DN93_c0_g1_i2:186-4022(-)